MITMFSRQGIYAIELGNVQTYQIMFSIKDYYYILYLTCESLTLKMFSLEYAARRRAIRWLVEPRSSRLYVISNMVLI